MALTVRVTRPLVARHLEPRIWSKMNEKKPLNLPRLNYLFLSWLIHRVTTARIHSSSLPLPLLSAFPDVFGGWKATLRPSCSGNCGASASRRAFGSLENGIACGPTEFRAGSVIDIPLVVVVVGAGVGGVAVPGGDGPLCRFCRLSVDKGVSYQQFGLESMLESTWRVDLWCLPERY